MRAERHQQLDERAAAAGFSCGYLCSRTRIWLFIGYGEEYLEGSCLPANAHRGLDPWELPLWRVARFTPPPSGGVGSRKMTGRGFDENALFGSSTEAACGG